MTNRESFILHICNKWAAEKCNRFETGGLIGLTNKKAGDLAETYVISRISRLNTKYDSYKTDRSRTPADIVSFGKIKDITHIMLIQSKSSQDKENIYVLNHIDIDIFKSFAEFFKFELLSYTDLKPIWGKPIVISAGYAGVLTRQIKNNTSHNLIKTDCYHIIGKNISLSQYNILAPKVKSIHQL